MGADRLNQSISEETLRQICAWFKERPRAEHGSSETGMLVRDFGISQGMARMLRSLAARDQYTDCGCCESIGDHACGGACQRCSGSGRNPMETPCQLPHSLDCTCSWAEEM